jgi:hypothetical protein
MARDKREPLDEKVDNISSGMDIEDLDREDAIGEEYGRDSRYDGSTGRNYTPGHDDRNYNNERK